MYKLYFDGASRSNPGPASYGVTLIDPNGQEIDTDKKYIGTATCFCKSSFKTQSR